MRKGISTNSILEVGIVGYLLTILFNGYLMHLGLTIKLIGVIRPFIPEFFILCILLAWVVSKPKMLMSDLHLWLYLVLVAVLGLTREPSVHSILSVIRDYFEPIIVLTVISSYRITEDRKERLFCSIRNVFAFFIIVGCFFAVQQKSMGWRWTSEYFAGYAFWGVDRTASVRITSGWLGFKVLGTTGSAETFGFYNAYAILFLLYYGYRKKLVNYGLIATAFINLTYSGMKTPFLAIVLIVFAAFFLPRRKKIGVVGKSMIVVLGVLIFIYMIWDAGKWSESSMYLRLVYWRELLAPKHMINLLLPQNIFMYSDGAGNAGITGFWDNTYFYVMFSTGILGLLLLLKCVVLRYKMIIRTETNKFTHYSMLFLALSSVTTCIFFGRNFITTMFIVLGISTAVAKENKC